MKHIFSYNDKAAFDAAAAERPSGESWAATAGKKAVFSGRNVIVEGLNFRVGGSVFRDVMKHRNVLIYGVVPSELDTARYKDLGYTYIGHIFGKHVFVSDAQLAAKPYATGDEWKITLDLSAAGTATFTVKSYNAVGAYSKSVTLNWAAGDAVETVMAAFLAGSPSGVTADKVDASSFVVTVNGYVGGMGITLDAGNSVLERSYQGYQCRHYEGVPYGTLIEKQDGSYSTSAYVRRDRMLEYFAASGADTTGNAPDGADIIKQSRFNAVDNPLITSAFATYEDYINWRYENLNKAKYPVARQGLATFAFGTECASALAQVKHTRADGAEIYDFPNCRSAIEYGVSLDGEETGFEPGSAGNGGLAEAYLLYTQVLKDKSDPINVAIASKGGYQVPYNTTVRLAFQSGSSSAWMFYGGYGNLNGNIVRLYAQGARAFRAFDDSALKF